MVWIVNLEDVYGKHTQMTFIFSKGCHKKEKCNELHFPRFQGKSETGIYYYILQHKAVGDV